MVYAVMAVRKFTVEVVAAKAVPPKGGIRSADAFCELEYNGQRQKTGVKRQGLDPTWNEEFEFEMADIENGLRNIGNDIKRLGDGLLNITIIFEGYCFATVKVRNRFLGNVKIPINNVAASFSSRIVRWHLLQNGSVEGELGLRMWCNTGEPSSLRPGPILDMRGILGTHLQRRSVIQKNEAESKSNGLPSFRRVGGRIFEGAGSSSATNLHNLDEPIDVTNTLELTENDTENLLNERMEARAAHLKEVTDLVHANLGRVGVALEDSSRIEWVIQDTLPLCGSQIVAQSLQRTQSMVASKQSLEKLLVKHTLIPSAKINDAVDYERQLVECVTKTARDAAELQKELRDMEQKAYRANLALIKKYNREQMELFKKFQQEKEHRLDLFAASRRDSLDIVKFIESNSQPLATWLNTLMETVTKHEEKLQAEVLRELGGEAIEAASSSAQSECQICFEDIEGPSSPTRIGRDDLRQRSCLIPCNHAMICLPCATEIWKSAAKSCPFCKVKLTTKPSALSLGLAVPSKFFL